MDTKEALERIKNAPTIYVGCVSDIYTRCSYELNVIEDALAELKRLRELADIVRRNAEIIATGAITTTVECVKMTVSDPKEYEKLVEWLRGSEQPKLL